MTARAGLQLTRKPRKAHKDRGIKWQTHTTPIAGCRRCDAHIAGGPCSDSRTLSGRNGARGVRPPACALQGNRWSGCARIFLLSGNSPLPLSNGDLSQEHCRQGHLPGASRRSIKSPAPAWQTRQLHQATLPRGARHGRFSVSFNEMSSSWHGKGRKDRPRRRTPEGERKTRVGDCRGAEIRESLKHYERKLAC